MLAGLPRIIEDCREERRQVIAPHKPNAIGSPLPNVGEDEGLRSLHEAEGASPTVTMRGIVTIVCSLR